MEKRETTQTNATRAVLVTTAHRGVFFGYLAEGGYGYGSGDGYGYGDGILRCKPDRVTVTRRHLMAARACNVEDFDARFPSGAAWPEDLDAAVDAGLDVEWASKALGLPWPTWTL